MPWGGAFEQKLSAQFKSPAYARPSPLHPPPPPPSQQLNIDRCITGHTSAQGLHDYDSGDEREQQMVSNIIDNSGPATSRAVLSQLYPARSSAFPSSAPRHVYNFNNCSATLNIAGDNSAQKSLSIHLIPKWRRPRMVWVELHENEVSRATEHKRFHEATLWSFVFDGGRNSWQFTRRKRCESIEEF